MLEISVHISIVIQFCTLMRLLLPLGVFAKGNSVYIFVSCTFQCSVGVHNLSVKCYDNLMIADKIE